MEVNNSNRGFWDSLESPIIGLSPMDGVTDAPFRYIISKYSKPSLIMTEFTNVEGLARGAVNMLKEFIYDESERPIVAQIYGVELESFYKVALMCCYLDFNGIDINMGCPANKVARRGSGAGMIKIPEHARKVVQIVKKACEDWNNGITLEEAGIRPKLIAALKTMRPKEGRRQLLPVSVKTRIGVDEIVTEWWISTLLEEKPANLSLHGRTLKQMYLGEANWDEIAKAAKLCKGTGTTLLGNGDVKSLDDAKARIKDYGVDGVLVGRATFGNPWFFSGHEPTKEERFKVAIE
ncbi:MAG: tRNA-dihydrouridine synthase family protein, partial [Candidatus Peregrinibacteria bacterium]|nr:tRNA-dihydrouridine synthase family protein [Candidatus Peregrinibacteria bacterium]